MGSSRNRILGLAAASLAVGVVACDDATTDEVVTQSDGAVLQDDVTSASSAATSGESTIEVEFEATWDPELETLEFEVLNQVVNTPLLELRNGEVLREADQGLFCELRVTLGRPDTVGLATESIGLTPAFCGFSGFPYDTLGTFCADIRVDNFYPVEVTSTYAEITSVSPDTGHNGYQFPNGTGANVLSIPVGDNTPGDELGLFSHGDIAAGDGNTAQWTFEYTPEPFSFRGRIVGQVGESCDGIDNDCDGTLDEGARCYLETEACTENADCQSFNCDTGFCAAPLTEVCDSGNDEDGDGDIDCLDSDCIGDPICPDLTSCVIDEGITGVGFWSGTLDGQGNDYDESAARSGEDYTYYWTADADDDYIFSLCGSAGDKSMTIYDADCSNTVSVAFEDDDSGTLAACDTGSDPAIELTGVTAGDTYRIVVDGWDGDQYSFDGGGPFGLRIASSSALTSEAAYGVGACLDGSDNDFDGDTDCDDADCALIDGCPGLRGTCDNPYGIGIEQSESWSNDDDYDNLSESDACISSTFGVERVFQFIAPDTGTVNFQLDSTTNAVIYARQTCAADDGTEACEGAGTSETLSLDVQTGESWYIIVEATSSLATGEQFTLTATGSETYAGGTCDDTIDGDNDGDVDCADSDCALDPACTLPLPYSEDFSIDDGNWTPVVNFGTMAFAYGAVSGANVDDSVDGAWSTVGTGTTTSAASAYVESPVMNLNGQAFDVQLTATLAWEGEGTDHAFFFTYLVDGVEFKLNAGGMNTPWDTATWSNGVTGWGDVQTSYVTINETLAGTGGASTLQLRFYAYVDSSPFNALDGLVVDSVEVNPPAVEICDNGTDDNGNGDIDCADVQCDVACGPELDCSDGLDNETAGGAVGDGFIDCADLDCAADPFCLVTTLPWDENLDTTDGQFLEGGGWEYGAPTGSVINAAASAPNVWATDLDANYIDGNLYSLISKQFDLSAYAAQDLFFQFDYWLDTDDGWDDFQVGYSIDNGASFFLLTTATSGFPTSGFRDTDTAGYETARFDISFLAGESEVKFLLNFVPDNVDNFNGVAVDNFLVDLTPAEECTNTTDDDFDGDVDCAD